MKTFAVTTPKNDGNGVNKFGKNPASAAGDAVWEPGLAIPVAGVANTSLYISSTDETNDVGISITVQYITLAGLQDEVEVQLHATDARTFVDTGIDALWCNRAWVSGDNETLTGDVYISRDNTDAGGDGIPDTATDILAVIPAEDGQTMQAFYMVPTTVNGRTVRGFWLEGWYATLNKNSTAWGLLQLKYKTSSGSWRTIEERGVGQQAPVERVFPQKKFYAAGTILQIKVDSVSVACHITGQFDGELEFA